jgi:hypothetical protein
MTLWFSHQLIKTDMDISHITGLANRLYTTFITSLTCRPSRGTELPAPLPLCLLPSVLRCSSGPLALVTAVHTADSQLPRDCCLTPAHKSIDRRDVTVCGYQYDTPSCSKETVSKIPPMAEALVFSNSCTDGECRLLGLTHFGCRNS